MISSEHPSLLPQPPDPLISSSECLRLPSPQALMISSECPSWLPQPPGPLMIS